MRHPDLFSSLEEIRMDILQWPDYLIFAIFLMISLGIGIYHAFTGGKQRTTSEFITANRKMNFLPTALSMFVSFQSAIAILGSTAEFYTRGGQAFIGITLGIPMSIIVVERVVVPWLYPLKLTSMFEYLQMRFESKAVRVTGGLLGIIGAVVYTGIAMYAPSVAMEAVTGFPFAIAIPIMAVVATTYTALGGMRAVIWTDVFQFVILFGGLITSMVWGGIQFGGFTPAFRICQKDGRDPYFDFSPDPRVRHTFWGFVIGNTWSWIYVYGFNQAAVQRIASTKTETQARITMVSNIPFFVFQSIVLNLTAMITYAYFASSRCDPIESGRVASPNQVLPLYIINVFQNVNGMTGLFMATLYSGALSSVSSSLSGAAAITWMDIVKPSVPQWSDYKATILNKFLVALYGVIATAVAFMAATIQGPVTQVASIFTGSIGGPIFGLFLLGGLFSFVNWIGALIGTASGFLFTLWMILGNNLEGSGYRFNPPLPPAPIDGCEANRSANWTGGANVTMATHWQWQTTTHALYGTPSDAIAANSTEKVALEGIQNFYAVSYLWYGVVGSFVTIIVGILVSLATGRNKGRDIPERLLLKLTAKVWFYPLCGRFKKQTDECNEYEIPHEGTLELPARHEYQLRDAITGEELKRLAYMDQLDGPKTPITVEQKEDPIEMKLLTAPRETDPEIADEGVPARVPPGEAISETNSNSPLQTSRQENSLHETEKTQMEDTV